MGQNSGRFVPRDPDIPSIKTNQLTVSVKEFGTFPTSLQAKLLDKRPPSSKNPIKPRAQKKLVA